MIPLLTVHLLLAPAPMTTDTRPSVVIRLHTRRSRQARWELVGEFASREAAWAVLVKLPSGTHVWLNDVFASIPSPGTI